MKVWITDIAADGVSLVGHTKSYSQILLPGGEENVEKYMGTSAHVKVLSSSRWSCKAEIIENESEAAAGIQSSTSLHKKIALVESAGDTSNLNKKYGKAAEWSMWKCVTSSRSTSDGSTLSKYGSATRPEYAG